MASLTLQDKLALAYTSAGSMRKLAAALGVTHQKVGRWLREGDPGGAKSIPPDAAKAIGKVFATHVATTKQTAKEQGLPFRAALPIYVERKPMQTGELGDRVFSEHTQFLKRATLDRVVKQAHKSKRYAHVSARSVVDIQSYARREARAQLERRRKEGRTSALTPTELARSIAAKFETKLSSTPTLKPIFTQYTPIFPGSDLPSALDEFDAKLRTKHEPATGASGTRLADQLLFQLMPRPATRATQTKPRRARAARKNR